MSAIGRIAALIAALGLTFFLLGCAAPVAAGGDDPRHGFYGGIEVGASRLP